MKKKKQRKDVLIVAIIMVIVLVGAGFAGIIASCNKNKEDTSSSTVDPYYEGAMDIIKGRTKEPTNPPSNEQESQSESAEKVTVDPGPVDPASNSNDESGGSESEDEPSQSGSPVNPSGGSSSGSSVSPSGSTKNTETDTTEPFPISPITFPYKDDSTGILVEQLSNYNGYYIEDGQDAPVSDVAAIVVTNRSKSDLSFIGIGISQNGNSLAFSGSQIPAGATVIILEQDKRPYDGNPCYSCTANITKEELNLHEDKIKINAGSGDTFTVTNISGETLSSVKIQFKNYLPDEDVYVGGITYNVTIPDFEPDTEVEITSGHYDARYTQFVAVIIEE